MKACCVEETAYKCLLPELHISNVSDLNTKTE